MSEKISLDSSVKKQVIHHLLQDGSFALLDGLLTK